MVVSKSTLGRKRREYENLAKIDGVTEADVAKRQSEDAKIFGISLEEYTAQLEALKKPTSQGKREADKVMRDTLIAQTQEFLGFCNLAIKAERGEVKMDVAQTKAVFGNFGKVCDTLATTLLKAFDGYGAMTMIYTPKAVDKTADNLLAVHCGGWGDGSKNLRYQYAPRKLAVAKRSGYHDKSFVAVVADIPVIKKK